MFLKILFFLALAIPFQVFTQVDSIFQNPEHLVPFNDHGKWGWSDTLGNIVIKPEFEQTSFFHPSFDEKGIYSAYVKCKGNSNRYIFGKGLIIPKNYSLNENPNISISARNSIYVVTNEQNKIGLFDVITQQFVLKCEYDSIVTPSDFGGNIYLRKQSGSPFLEYNIIKNEIKQTDIKNICLWNHLDPDIRVWLFEPLYMHKDGSWTHIKDGKHVIEKFDIGKWEKYSDGSIGFVESYESKDDESIKSSLKSESDYQIIQKKYFRSDNIIKTYGFSELKIVRKGNVMGVVTESDIIIVPFEYDEIHFLEDGSKALIYKNGKIGLKLFFTNYPLIEAKYEYIDTYFTQIRVNNNWSFMVAQIKLNGNTGYIGENGIEYFNFK